MADVSDTSTPNLPPAMKDHLTEGRIIPFLGAGASLTGPVTPASASELAKILAERSGFPLSDDEPLNLALIASFYYAEYGPDLLKGELHDRLAGPFEPGRIHRYLASLGASLLVITTNYDGLLEQAFREAGHDPHIVYHPFDNPERAGVVLWHKPGTDPEHFVEFEPLKLTLPIGKEPVIYKMHGHRHDSSESEDAYLITEEHYVEFLAGMQVPPVILRKLNQSALLFLGYGLRDWNVRVLLRNLRQGGSGKAWAVQRDPGEIDEHLWRNRNVTILKMEIDQFVERLEALQ